jgi:hypothetical protein
MIDILGPRPTALSGPAASATNAEQGEKIVHRPPTRVLPVEQVDRNAPAGPRPAFKHTYLEQAAAFWPNEPDPPATRIDYDLPEETPAPAPEPVADEARAVRADGAPAGPTVDIMR